MASASVFLIGRPWIGAVNGPDELRCRLWQAAAAVLAGQLLAGSAFAAGPDRPTFTSLRQDEDWSALCDPARRMPWFDAIKCVPLGADRAAWLSLGGEVRERYEYTHNPLWGEDPQDKQRRLSPTVRAPWRPASGSAPAPVRAAL